MADASDLGVTPVGRDFLLSLLAASAVIGVAGCRDAVTGLLTVRQPLSLASGGRTETFLPGDYPVRIAADGQKLRMEIERSRGDVVRARFSASSAPDRQGAWRIPSNATGQPVDVLLSLTSSKSEVPLGSARTSCRADVMETRCRTIVETDFATGQQSSREVCDYVPVDRPGSRTTSSFRETSARIITGQLLDPRSGAEVAHLVSRRDHERTYTVESACVASFILR